MPQNPSIPLFALTLKQEDKKENAPMLWQICWPKLKEKTILNLNDQSEMKIL
jgi:hypothetical protein